MAVNSAAVGVAITGALHRGASGATAPTSTSSALTGYTELGWISEDGVTRSHPDAGDATAIVGWQNGQQIRVIRKPSTENPTYGCVLLETTKATIEASLGVTVTQTSAEGSYVLDTSVIRPKDKWVLDIIDGADLERHYIPQGEVVALGDVVYKNDEPIGYEITIEAHRDATLGGQVKVFSTRLKTPA